MGEWGEYEFSKIYMSPFDDLDIEKYISKRYRFYQLNEKTKLREFADSIKDLTVRPMLLEYAPELIESGRRYEKLSVVYWLMIESWIKRECPKVDSNSLLKFSEHVAVDMYINSNQRGMEAVPYKELIDMASSWNIDFDFEDLRGNSLLNKDAVGNYKFTHRSFMEYLFVKRAKEGDVRCSNIYITEFMKRVAIESVAVWNTLPKKIEEYIVNNRVSINFFCTDEPVCSSDKQACGVCPHSFNDSSLQKTVRSINLALDEIGLLLESIYGLAEDNSWDESDQHRIAGISNLGIEADIEKYSIVRSGSTLLLQDLGGRTEYISTINMDLFLEDIENGKGHKWRYVSMSDYGRFKKLGVRYYETMKELKARGSILLEYVEGKEFELHIGHPVHANKANKADQRG